MNQDRLFIAHSIYGPVREDLTISGDEARVKRILPSGIIVTKTARLDPQILEQLEEKTLNLLGSKTPHTLARRFSWRAWLKPQSLAEELVLERGGNVAKFSVFRTGRKTLTPEFINLSVRLESARFKTKVNY